MRQVHEAWETAANQPRNSVLRFLGFLPTFQSPIHSFAMSVWLAAFFFLAIRKSSKSLILLSGFACLGVIFFLAVFRKTPDRVVVPILLLPIILAPLMCELVPLRRGRLQAIIAILVVVAGTRMTWSEFTNARRVARRSMPAIRHDYQQLVDRGDGLYVICFPNGIHMQLPLVEWPEFRRLNAFWVDWLQRSPYSDAVLERAGIDDLVDALLTRDDVFLVSGQPFRDKLTEFLYEHRGIRVREELAMTGDSHLRAYRLRREPDVAAPRTATRGE
jgi:hypothetical protein